MTTQGSPVAASVASSRTRTTPGCWTRARAWTSRSARGLATFQRLIATGRP
ncbi:MAG: hypothetical protein R3F62_17415 [Planctomycetota bacterium]